MRPRYLPISRVSWLPALGRVSYSLETPEKSQWARTLGLTVGDVQCLICNIWASPAMVRERNTTKLILFSKLLRIGRVPVAIRRPVHLSWYRPAISYETGTRPIGFPYICKCHLATPGRIDSKQGLHNQFYYLFAARNRNKSRHKIKIA